MVFSSGIFLLFFLPVFLIIYLVLPHKLKNYFILVSSIVFYAWGAPIFVFVVLGSIILDFFIVRLLYNSKEKSTRNWLLFISMLINVGLLAYFKYANFFIENVNILLTSMGVSTVQWVKIALPIGISFFTFQKITYTVDVYRNKHKPLKLITDYALYILMFPQLIAGPIVRYHEIADEIVDRRKNEHINNKLMGFFRFSVGLAKKVFIANTIGIEVDQIFSMPTEELSMSVAWVGIIAYAFQIYFDFSGYSDMAIGLGQIMGFTFPENFKNPYISQSITEFWRRWHITLGRWMKDYLYIPLGGNKVKKHRLFINLWLVFLISGLWHGAAWNFIIWGAFHGLFLIADRLFLLKFYKVIGKVPSVLITFIIVLVGWVYFRADSFTHANEYLSQMFSFDPELYKLKFMFNLKFIVFMLVAIFFAFWGIVPKLDNIGIRLYNTKSNTLIVIVSIISIVLILFSISSIVSSGFNPFIYFRF